MPDDDLIVNAQLRIPMAEIIVRASRSGGPGGQHANVTASKIEAVWDVTESQVVSDWQRERITERLGPVVRSIAQDTRSQAANRDLALERLAGRLAAALVVERPRRKTKPTKGSVQRRLGAKKQQAQRKAGRRRPSGED